MTTIRDFLHSFARHENIRVDDPSVLDIEAVARWGCDANGILDYLFYSKDCLGSPIVIFTAPDGSEVLLVCDGYKREQWAQWERNSRDGFETPDEYSPDEFPPQPTLRLIRRTPGPWS